MQREGHLDVLQNGSGFDVLVIGGGASGLGVAVDAATRGYRVALVERFDFAKGTSSRSTKLIHGGVRYLQQGNVGLVMEALRERGRLRRNAPHLVHDVPFVIPSYGFWDKPYYGLGMKIYDLLAGRFGFAGSRLLDREESLQWAPTLNPEGLRGSVVYRDGQFDDARLAIHLARTAADHGAILVNYATVVSLRKNEGGRITGAEIEDGESGRRFDVKAKVVVNATGAWTDSIRKMDSNESHDLIRPSQGVHVVLRRHFLPGEAAVLVPKTEDGRVLFAIPWNGGVVAGTTDTPIDDLPVEPEAQAEELEFILSHVQKYLTPPLSQEDICSVYTGIRPLVSAKDGATKALARNHRILVSAGAMVTVAGGKWTTYRQMAQDVVDRLIKVADLPDAPCRTAELPLHGAEKDAASRGRLAVYGTDGEAIEAECRQHPQLRAFIHPRLPIMKAQVRYAARWEMARTVEDVLARRTRALLMDAEAAVQAAPQVAHMLAQELGRPAAWVQQQVQSFEALGVRHGHPPPVAKARLEVPAVASSN